MRKDFKIGSLIGLLFVAILMWTVATRQTLNIESRILDEESQAVTPGIPTAALAAHIETDAASTAPQPIQQVSPSQKAPKKRFYTVQKGDTLSDISSKFYGTSSKLQKIYKANKDKMKDPAHIMPGMKLVIPD